MLKAHHYARSVLHRVADLERACGFLETVLGFAVRERGGDWIELDNGALTLRLLADPQACGRLDLELRTSEPALSAAELAAFADLEAVDGLREVGPGRLERRYRGPEGLGVLLVRQASAEELGIDLPLPTSLAWENEARELANRALRFVPRAFRAGALQRTAGRAEELALSGGEIEVDAGTCLRALLAVTPEFQQERLKLELKRLGYEAAPEAV